MVRRSTWIVLGIFVLLLVSLLVYQRVSKKEADEEPVVDIAELSNLEPIEQLFNIPIDAYVTGLLVENYEGGRVEIRRNGKEEDWLLIEPAGDADQDTIDRVIDQILSVEIDESLTEEIGLDSLGLEEASKTISLRISNGGVFKLYIGDVTITNTSYYARITGRNPLVLKKFPLDSVLNWLDDPPIQDPPTSTPEM